MNHRKSLLSAAIFSCLVFGAQAQETATPTDLDTVSVVGIRASLEKSLDTKRNNVTISEAITAAAAGAPAALAATGLGFSLGQGVVDNVAHGRSIVSISTSSLAGSEAKRHCRLRRKTGSSGTVEEPRSFHTSGIHQHLLLKRLVALCLPPVYQNQSLIEV